MQRTQKVNVPYKKDAKLNRGTYGVVFNGTFTNPYASKPTPRPAAIKELVTLTTPHYEVFKKEKAILELIDQKNQENGYPEEFFGYLVKCYGSYFEEDRIRKTPLKAVIVMELAICDLSTWLARYKNDPVNWAVTYPLMKNLSCALYTLHYLCNVIHRDLKPANVLLFNNEKGQVIAKLADFGLSILQDENQPYGTGTLLYSAPEILGRQPNTFSSDVYSFATILWEMANSGKEIYSDIIAKHIQKDEINLRNQIWSYRKTSKVPENCPEKIKRLLPWCFTFSPNHRPDAKAIYDELSTDLNIVSENLHRRPI